MIFFFFFFSSRRRHTRSLRDWSSDVCSSDLGELRFPARAREYYIRGLVDAVDVEGIRRRSPKLVVDYAHGGTTLTGPQVLGLIGAEVLAINGTLDPDRVVFPPDQAGQNLDDLRRLVRASGAEVGAMMDSTGELLRLVDGAGRLLDPRTALLAFVSLVAGGCPSPRVALPVSTTRVAEDIIRSAGGEVLWTKISPAALMRAADEGSAVFAGDEGGG